VRTALVALALGIPTDRSPPVILRGVTGFATVPTIRVDTLSVGDVAVDQAILPIVPDALGGAEGVLGSEGLVGKRIFIDFRHDRINIAYSKNERSVPVRQACRSTRCAVPWWWWTDSWVKSAARRSSIPVGRSPSREYCAERSACAHQRCAEEVRPTPSLAPPRMFKGAELMATPATGLGAISIHDPGVTFGGCTYSSSGG
jgi:hypothetical protein